MPISGKRFTLDDGASIATAGSCFAQEIGKYLESTAEVALFRAEPVAPDQPLFSALYGNIYTVRQLVQLYDRAFGSFVPRDTAWQRDDGRYVDPFRPYVYREGFAGPDRVAAARGPHLGAVRRVFTESSIFVFTMGLTESWRSLSDGAVFPVAPGVVRTETPAGEYEFHNFDYDEVSSDLRRFLSCLRSVNPQVRVILTVSPVPLTATYTDEHILVANTDSKAILRAVCGAANREFDFVSYFPSYEIVANPFNQGRYYSANLRSVTGEGVEHVMTLFRQTYFDAPQSRPTPRPVTAPPAQSEAAALMCDDEEIVRTFGFD